MIVVALVLAALGAVVHGYIFWLESLAWTGQRARRIFGLTAEQARTTAPLALNQGFYNLFLGVEVLIGVVLVAAGARVPGFTAVIAGAASMVGAALVLVVSDRTKRRAALVQGAAPAAGLLVLLVCALIRG